MIFSFERHVDCKILNIQVFYMNFFLIMGIFFFIHTFSFNPRYRNHMQNYTALCSTIIQLKYTKYIILYKIQRKLKTNIPFFFYIFEKCFQTFKLISKLGRTEFAIFPNLTKPVCTRGIGLDRRILWHLTGIV